MNSIDFSAMENQIDAMYAGDVDAILNGLDHKGCLFRINAIVGAYDNNVRDFRVVEKVKSLKEDKNELDSIAVGDYAKAFLHLYGIEKYQEDKKYVKYMIENKMDI